ncbi:MAG TPA: hypothetical protein VMV47_15900 [Bacteroidales bacterium]|nr:hypothetical protein [Bacteroidales bacterium]
MRALAYISVGFLFLLGSCSATQYAGGEYDDLYYSSSDNPPVRRQNIIREEIAEQNLNVDDYYDNKYAVDTLVSGQFNDALQNSDQVIINNYSGGNGYDYYDSYSGRLNMFYGNYFDPYWRDPYYFSFNYGYPYSSFGFGFGYPYFGLGFNRGWGYPYSPYYSYYYQPYYGGYYSPYYSRGYYSGYGDEDSYVNYGRRERPSTMSSRANANSGGGGVSAYSRRDVSSMNSRSSASEGRVRSYAGNESASSSIRRTDPSAVTGVSKAATSARTVTQDAKGGTSRSPVSAGSESVSSRPEYKSTNRTYLPSYNNPRMSTRPSYNNSRTPSGNSYQKSGSNYRSNPSYNGNQRSTVSRSSNRVQYSVPTRRSAESGGSISSGSYNKSSSSGYSGASRSGSRSSYSGGSSYSSGSSSFSSGSSSYSSGSSSRSSSGSSSGRR